MNDLEAARASAMQEVGAMFGVPTGESITDYAAEVRKMAAAYPRLKRVAAVAKLFHDEMGDISPTWFRTDAFIAFRDLKTALEKLEPFE